MRFFWLCFFLLLGFGFSNGHVFRCLDGSCLCDTDEELISCHNNDTRTEVPLPSKRLRGFVVLGITKNNLTELPDESILRSKFPDLQGIDVYGNPHFDCSILPNYQQIHILSHCENETAEYPTVEVYMPKEDTFEDGCDMKCEVTRHAKTARDYMHKIWETLLKKLDELRQHELVREVEGGVSEIANSIYEWLRHHT